MKSIKVPMSNKTHWTIFAKKTWTIVGAGKKRHIAAWSFADQEGYERIVEGSWIDLVAEFNATAERFGLTAEIELRPSIKPSFTSEKAESQNLGFVSDWYRFDCAWHLEALLLNPEGAPPVLIGDNGVVYLWQQ